MRLPPVLALAFCLVTLAGSITCVVAQEDNLDPYGDERQGGDLPQPSSFLPDEEIEAGTRNDIDYGDSMDEDWGSFVPNDDGYDMDTETLPDD